MSRALWLPEVLRAAGLTVHEVDGWRTRGDSAFEPRGVICHATAGSSTSTDAGEIRVLLEGSTSAPPPIAQLYLSRTGHWWVVASGRCNHARVGWGGPLEGLGNTYLIGVEAQNDNRGQPWPAVQVDSYQRGVAAICRRMGWTPGRNVAAHREHQPGAKSDPYGIDMGQFRARVGALLAGEDDPMSALTDAEQRELLTRLRSIHTITNVAGYRIDALVSGKPTYDNQMGDKASPNVLAQQLAALVKAAGVDPVDEQAIVAGVLAGLDPAAIAAAIPPELAKQVADVLHARLAA